VRLETDLRNFLIAAPAVAALVAQRVYGLIREPGSALPSVNVQRTHTLRQELFCGVSTLASADMQIDAFGINGDDAWTLARALRETFKNFSGDMGDTVVKKVFLINEFPLTDSDPGVIRVVQLYNFWYLED
jgi:Protein of unknown function (DUF3168)